MKRILIATGFALLLLTNIAFASKWQRIGWGSNIHDPHYAVFMDMSSIAPAGPHRVKVWMRYDYSVAVPLASNPSQLAWSNKSLEVYDCLNKLGATASQAYFDAKGEYISSLTGPSLSFAPIVPDTISDHVSSLLCQPVKHRHTGKRTPI